MTTETQIVCGWINYAFVPIARFEKQCRANFVAGERYIVEVLHQSDWIGRKAYFGKVAQLFRNWPERLDRQFDSAEHLRAWALIRTRHRVERPHVCATNAEALRLAVALRTEKPYCEVSIHDKIVFVWEALSQAAQAMGAKEFAKSSNDVIGFLCDLVGTTEDELSAQYKASKIISPALLPGNETGAVARAASDATSNALLTEDRGPDPSPSPRSSGEDEI